MRPRSFYFLLLLLYSCTPQYERPLQFPPLGPVRFDMPQPGQRSYYRAFTCILKNGVQYLEYLPDTLMLEVAGAERGAFILRECAPTAQEEPYLYRLKIDDDALFILPVRDQRFLSGELFSGLDQPLPLSPCSGPVITNLAWKIEGSNGAQPLVSCYDGYSSLGLLTVWQDTRRMAGDGPGFMYVYSAEAGLERCSKFYLPRRKSEQRGKGWMLIKPGD